MKSWLRGRNILSRLALGTSLLAMGIVFAPQVGNASAAPNNGAASVIPALPSTGSSTASWQSWASAEQSALQSANPESLVAASAGCTQTSVSLIPIVSTGSAGIPAGIVTDAIDVVGTCGGGGSSLVHPLLSSYCPNMTNCTYQGATNGEVAVGTATVEGNVNFMGAAYTYTASGSGYTAHAELGTVSSGCSVGTLVANSSDSTFSTNQYVEILWGPRSGSNTWSGTGWHYYGSGYTNLGTVCAQY